MRKILKNENGSVLLIMILLIPLFLFVYGISMDLININLNTQKLIQVTDSSTLATAVASEIKTTNDGSMLCTIGESSYSKGEALFEKNIKSLNNVSYYEIIFNKNKVTNLGNNIYMKESDVGVVSSLGYAKIKIYFVKFFSDGMDGEFVIYSESSSECQM
ncbi:hypothetical protein KHQ81_15545 (plasmid) [Mycoplasmatota bacterium]|nr:hypothetical protein KHQ81_15545 [Mycoplasmatota bacterium]